MWRLAANLTNTANLKTSDITWVAKPLETRKNNSSGFACRSGVPNLMNCVHAVLEKVNETYCIYKLWALSFTGQWSPRRRTDQKHWVKVWEPCCFLHILPIAFDPSWRCSKVIFSRRFNSHSYRISPHHCFWSVVHVSSNMSNFCLPIMLVGVLFPFISARS